MERDDWCCLHCGDDSATLSVHHTVYRKNREPWEYVDSELLTLCEDCHSHHEHYKKELLETVGQLHYHHIAMLSQVARCLRGSKADSMYGLILALLAGYNPSTKSLLKEIGNFSSLCLLDELKPQVDSLVLAHKQKLGHLRSTGVLEESRA